MVGVNIGKNGDRSRTPLLDYAYSARMLAPYADYLVVNVSSPNTPGLRHLQSVDALRPILEHARAGAEEGSPGRRVPLLVKIAPDLADADVDAVADLALDWGSTESSRRTPRSVTTAVPEGCRDPLYSTARSR